MQEIGEVTESTLVIYTDQDLDFDVTWQQRDGSPINYAAVESRVVDSDSGATLLDIGANTQLEGNVAFVRVPRSTLDSLTVGSLARWAFIGTSTSGSVKILTRGNVRIKNGI